jgi:hypothetical protein
MSRLSPTTTRHDATHAQGVMADLALWVGLVGFLQLFRAVMLGLFCAEMGGGAGLIPVLRCFSTGFRFDASVATYLCLPLAALAITGCFKPLPRLHRAVRAWLVALTASILSLAFVADIGYFQAFHNQFDHWLWGLVFDDRRAIALTVWKSYPVVGLLLGMVLLGWWMSWLLRRWIALVARRCPPLNPSGSPVRGVVLGLLLVVVVAFGLRGSLGRRPVQIRDAAVCDDRLLDKLVPNPLSALRYAVAEQLALLHSVGLETLLPRGDIRGAARALNPRAKPDASLDDYLERTAAGTRHVPPQHIFLVVMESYDAWAMQPKFQCLHLMDRLAALGRAGLMAQGFVPAGPGTMPSLGSLLCGLPEVGIHPNYRAAVRTGVPTAPAKIFKRLGYRTRFFYGGYLSWQRLGEFCREQGFDEVYGGAAMAPRLSGNEWGVEDRILFRFALDQTGEQRTFNVIMTTSDHPPYSVNVEAEGFPLKQMPAELSQYRVSAHELHVLGHLWYSDRCLGEFSEQLTSRFPLSLLAITGDHWSRRCLDASPSVFERKAVPFVLYGPAVLTNVACPGRLAGSHLDILPTLIELSAPTHFHYHAFGRNLLDCRQPQFGFGCGAVIAPDFLFEVGRPSQCESLAGEVLPRSSHSELVLRYRQLQALAWWRIMKGNALPPAPSPPR